MNTATVNVGVQITFHDRLRPQMRAQDILGTSNKPVQPRAAQLSQFPSPGWSDYGIVGGQSLLRPQLPSLPQGRVCNGCLVWRLGHSKLPACAICLILVKVIHFLRLIGAKAYLAFSSCVCSMKATAFLLSHGEMSSH